MQKENSGMLHKGSWLQKTLKKGLLLTLNLLSCLLTACATSAEARPLPTPLAVTLASTITPTPTSTLQPSATPTPVPSEIPPTPQPTTLPEEHYIGDISGHKQFYALGCEAASAVDWAGYFNVPIYESDFQFSLPLSGNPELGFVGSVDGPWGQTPPYAYGVYAGPVADALNRFGLPAKAVENYTLEEIKSQIALDRPVIVWVIGNCVGGYPAEYTDSAGNTVIVAAYEHVIIVTGYNQEKIRYMNNGRFYETTYALFENSWSVLGKLAVIYEPSQP